MSLVGIDLNIQVIIFLWSLVLGSILGLLYDIFKSVRFAFKSNKKHLFIQDIIYCLLCGFLTFLFSLAINRGNLRFYIIMGEFLGFFIYQTSVSKIFMKVTITIIIIIKKVLHKIYKIIFSPIISIVKKIIKSVFKSNKKEHCKLKVKFFNINRKNRI